MAVWLGVGVWWLLGPATPFPFLGFGLLGIAKTRGQVDGVDVSTRPPNVVDQEDVKPVRKVDRNVRSDVPSIIM